ncbi:MAG: glycosyltransferase [Pedobacter sp.]|uniref:glycosyltransferase n=1 Tax=Pedobacter sp. TaxID=1411316 RepID=UPI002809C4BF|nr:glycosyltransferase [Pedobacter sp.]MDQ8004876.1 glycosyltransferase [Pedobacter sp.]
MSGSLPKILYISDVSAVNTTGGELVLFRLLENYPGEVRIIESNLKENDVNKKLPVEYVKLRYPLSRLYKTRFTAVYNTLIYFLSYFIQKKLMKLIKDYRPDIILSVSHHLLYINAFKVAEKRKVPFICIHHDYFYHSVGLLQFAKKHLTRDFQQLYTKSKNLCVSEFLKEFYENKFGKTDAEILYPLQPLTREPPQINFYDKQKLTFGYLGSINTPGLINDMIKFAHEIETSGHKLILLSNITLNVLRENGLKTNNIVIGGWVEAKDLVEYIQKNIDILLLIQDMSKFSKQSVSTNFPSKLVDYTLTGLPIVIIGKEYSSGIKFAKANPEIFYTVEEIASQQIKKLTDCSVDFNVRRKFGEKAYKFGKENFANHIIKTKFYGFIKSYLNS